jgi:hypothetical protein
MPGSSTWRSCPRGRPRWSCSLGSPATASTPEPSASTTGRRTTPRPARSGFLVRSGRFATEAEAAARRERLVTAGYPGPRVVFTGEDGGLTSGPWVVTVLEIDPDRYAGTLAPALATGIVPGREPLSALAGRTGALAALNGGYFVIGAANGTDGDLAGSSLISGDVVSEAVDGRTGLMLPDASGDGAFVSALSDRLTVTTEDGASRELDGLNRVPGLIRGCGGSGGDLPTERPKHDFTCTDESELIRYAPIFGAATPNGSGVEAALDGQGTVTELRGARGGPIPAGGSVLAGTGEAAEWLHAHARPGTRLDVIAELSTESGPLAPGPRPPSSTAGRGCCATTGWTSPPTPRASTGPRTPSSSTASGCAATHAPSPA